MGPGRPKNQSAQNHFKTDVCIGLIVTNPTQLERAQTDTVCERYHVLFILPNMQNFVDCTVRTVLTWQLTVQVIRPYSDMAGTVGMLTGQTCVVTGGRIMFDTWHILGKCNGATWPSLGLPRGTPPLVGWKNLWTPRESNP
jgi:hypothetical protein